MNDTKKRGSSPGSNNGGGRKKSERPLVKVAVRLYADQLPISNADIRAAIDLHRICLENEE